MKKPKILGLMIDVSRNAVMSVEALKNISFTLKNGIQLRFPLYGGHLRGRGRALVNTRQKQKERILWGTTVFSLFLHLSDILCQGKGG